MNSPRKVLVICPLCEKRGEILIPEGVIQENKGTSTVLVRAGVTCNHSYQVFLDKNCKVRGYQRTDYEVPVTQPLANAPQTFTRQENPSPSPTATKSILPVGSDHQITLAIQAFIPKVDEYLSASTCAKGILDLHNFIQSRRGFHPVLPDMKNWINQLQYGAPWDAKAKDWVKKRAMIWLEKAS